MKMISQTEEVELWGVVYFAEDGTIASAELLRAAVECTPFHRTGRLV